MGRRLNSHTVSVTIELPVEVAEFIVDNGDRILAAFRHAVDDFKFNPPPDRAEEIRQARELERAAWNEKLAHLGRTGFRTLRAREAAFEYHTRDGYPRKPGNSEKNRNRKDFIAEIATELGEHAEYVMLAIGLFRKKFRAKLRDRRRRETWRYVQQGLSNKEIGKRLKVNPGTVSRDLAYFREQQHRKDQS